MRKYLLILILCLFALDSHAWTICNDPIQVVTNNGIVISIPNRAFHQYEQYWGRSFSDIQWDDIDVFFNRLAQAYGVTPKSGLKINIVPFDTVWIDNETPVNPDGTVGREMEGSHYDGEYWQNTIWIHLGDDTGVGPNAWCQTALDYELGHYFLQQKGDPCWYYEFDGDCPRHYISAHSVGLCQQQDPLSWSDLIPADIDKRIQANVVYFGGAKGYADAIKNKLASGIPLSQPVEALEFALQNINLFLIPNPATKP
jgi:hypothetical protein